MAKFVLNGEIIDYIVSVRNDTSKKFYSYQDIADMVSNKFNVSVKMNTIRRAYLKHSDSINQNTSANNQNKLSNLNKPNTGISGKKEKASKPVDRPRTFVEATD